MVCKAVFTFLVIGALSVNVSAIPVPARVHVPLSGFWNKISPTSIPSGESPTLSPSSEVNPHKDDAPPPTPPPKDYPPAPVPSPKDDAPAQDAPAKNSSDPKPRLGSKLLSSAGTMAEATVPMVVGSLFSGYATRKLLDASESGSGNSSSSNSSSSNSSSNNPSSNSPTFNNITITFNNPSFNNPSFNSPGSSNLSFSIPGTGNSGTGNHKRELAPDPPPLYIAVRTIIDNHSRAPSDGPIRPKRESESESKDSDCVDPLPALKREPVSVDEVLDPLSSLKRVPEPEPPRCSKLSSHPHGQALDIESRPRFKREPQTWGEQGNYVGNYYVNKYGSPDDVPGLSRYYIRVRLFPPPTDQPDRFGFATP